MSASLREWHRLVGAMAALFLIVLAGTGILLNHSEALGLQERFVTNGWVLSQYKLDKLPANQVYHTSKGVVSQYGEQLFFDSKPVAKGLDKLLGAVALEEMLVLAFEERLLLLTHEGVVIESLQSGTGMPSQIQNIGEYHGEPVLQTRSGMWRSDFMLDAWENISLPGVRWSALGTMPEAFLGGISEHSRGHGVNAEQLILDIHNGRILGKIEPWLLDLVALLIIGLSLSGLWLWVQRLVR